MRLIIMIVFVVFFVNEAYASDTQYYAALRFAREYETELSASRQAPLKGNSGYQSTGPQDDSAKWQAQVTTRIGQVKYEEAASPIKSDWESIYAETSVEILRESTGDVQTSLGVSFGQSLTADEDWFLNNTLAQTNEMDFYRLNLKGAVGKILYSDRSPDLRVIPFLGYGFRLIDFTRTRFLVGRIFVPGTVTEKYYIHYFNAGLKFDNKFNSKWGYSGMASFGYPVYSLADNSVGGKISGGEGYLVNGELNLDYYVNDSWQLKTGGFVELQNLKGGENSDYIWPENDLNIFGGTIGVEYRF